jgi:hypothetical protein
MYLNWRHFDADVTCNGAAVNNAVGVNGALTTAACGGAAVVGASKKLPTENFDAIVFGARVKF